MRKIAFQTLGCKLNFSESSELLNKFIDNDFQHVDFKDIADVYVINTCCVTAVAEKKCRTVIRQAIRQNPDAVVAVIGCFAQIDAQEIRKISGVDIVLGNDKKHLLFEMIENKVKSNEQSAFFPATSSSDRTRVFMKIQDGCDYYCAYCTIPFARGHNRSDSLENVVARVKKEAERGTKEIILTGINLGEFRDANFNFFDVIKQIDGLVPRYRISSIEPNLISDEMLEFIATSKSFLPHFHIPLQSASDKILTLMKRRYNREFFAERLRKIKTLMPDAFIAADVIVGFPNETDADFEDACRFIETLPLAYLHIFPFSERPNTLAAKMDNKVSPETKKSRAKRLLEISDRKHQEFLDSQKGKSFKVLWEAENHNETMSGWSENYLRFQKPFDKEMVNTISEEELRS